MITEDEWEMIAAKVMALPGMITDHDSDFEAEDSADDMSYIKFMSDKGITDDDNGNTLKAYMLAQGCKVYGNRARSMEVHDADLRKLFL